MISALDGRQVLMELSTTRMLSGLRQWQQALRLYRAGDWDGAELQIYNLRREAPENRLYALYTERGLAQESAGRNWDGTTTYQTK